MNHNEARGIGEYKSTSMRGEQNVSRADPDKRLAQADYSISERDTGSFDRRVSQNNLTNEGNFEIEPNSKEEFDTEDFEFNRRIAEIKQNFGLVPKPSEEFSRVAENLSQMEQRLSQRIDTNTRQSQRGSKRGEASDVYKKTVFDTTTSDFNYVSPKELGDTLTRNEHTVIMEKELRKLENRFFDLFQEERRDILQKSSRELKEIQERTKARYESKIRDLELRLDNLSHLSKENERLKTDLNSVLETESKLINENRRLVIEFENEKRKLQDRIMELELRTQDENVSKKSTEVRYKERVQALMAENEELKHQIKNSRILEKSEIEVLREEVLRLQEELRKSNKRNTELKETIKKMESQSRLITSFDASHKYEMTLDPTMNSTKSIKERDLFGSPKAVSPRRNAARSKNNLKPAIKSSQDLQRDIEFEELKGELRKVIQEVQTLKEQRVADESVEQQARDERQPRPVERYSPSRRTRSQDYEDLKLRNMETEINLWKEKSQILSSKFFNALQDIRTESTEIKDEMRRKFDMIQEETGHYLNGFMKLYKKKMNKMEERLGYYQRKYSDYLATKGNRNPSQGERRDKKAAKTQKNLPTKEKIYRQF